MDGRRALFHGTVYDVGKYVRPAQETGVSVWGAGPANKYGHDARTVAHASESEATAWRFAKRAGEMKRSEHAHGYARPGEPPPGRARVHEVAPHPQMRQGFHHSAGGPNRENLQEWVAPKFRVKSTQDIQPGHQGTFPHLNWNQFAHPDMDPGGDANHPTWDEIEDGHTPKWGSDTHHQRFEQTFGFSQREAHEMSGRWLDATKKPEKEVRGQQSLF